MIVPLEGMLMKVDEGVYLGQPYRNFVLAVIDVGDVKVKFDKNAPTNVQIVDISKDKGKLVRVEAEVRASNGSLQCYLHKYDKVGNLK